MSFISGPVSVRIPASSANLGPGYDALGLALTLYDEMTAEVTGDELVIDVRGEGAGQVPLDDRHLVVKAMYAAFDLLGERPSGIVLRCRNSIPHGRGLGSSSAAIVGGIVLARALATAGTDRVDDQAAYQLAHDLEGHPDNVAAALFGGLTIAWLEGTVAAVARRDVMIDATAFVPPAPVSTEEARGLLPDSVDHRDASANAGRAALLVAALDGAPELLLAATEDRLHQQFRASVMPESYQLLQQLRADGIPTVISGAGPTVLAFGRDLGGWLPDGWALLEVESEPAGAAVLTA